MSFMVPEIVHGEWYEVDGDCGVNYIPGDCVYIELDLDRAYDDDDQEWPAILEAVKDYTESKRVDTVTRMFGYGAQLSAPGYMDQTGWSVYSTEAEAAGELISMFYDQAEEDMTEDEKAELEELEAIAAC